MTNVPQLRTGFLQVLGPLNNQLGSDFAEALDKLFRVSAEEGYQDLDLGEKSDLQRTVAEEVQDNDNARKLWQVFRIIKNEQMIQRDKPADILDAFFDTDSQKAIGTFDESVYRGIDPLSIVLGNIDYDRALNVLKAGNQALEPDLRYFEDIKTKIQSIVDVCPDADYSIVLDSDELIKAPMNDRDKLLAMKSVLEALPLPGRLNHKYLLLNRGLVSFEGISMVEAAISIKPEAKRQEVIAKLIDSLQWQIDNDVYAYADFTMSHEGLHETLFHSLFYEVAQDDNTLLEEVVDKIDLDKFDPYIQNIWGTSVISVMDDEEKRKFLDR